MPKYKRNEAREWARQELVGCSGVTIPSYTQDLKRLNEKGIRHDIQRIVDLGYKYTLLCTEVAITPEENAQFTAWAKETAGDKLGLFFHAGFGTLAENIEAAPEDLEAEMVTMASAYGSKVKDVAKIIQKQGYTGAFLQSILRKKATQLILDTVEKA